MVLQAGLPILSSEAIGVAYLLTGAGLGLLLREPLRRLERPGSKGFALAVVAICLWPLSAGLNVFVADPQLSQAIWNVRLFAAALVAIGWFLLAFEFTTQRLPGRPVLVALAGYLLVGQVLAWTDPLHGLVLGPGTGVVDGAFRPEYGPWFWVQTLVNYGFIVVATALLAAEAVRESGLRRTQSVVLAVAVVPPIAANVLTIHWLFDTARDLTPFGLVGAGVVLSWALYRMEVLDIVPVGREVTVEGMQDAVVTVDDQDRVVDCNRAARTLLDVGDRSYGLPIEEFFAPVPSAALEGLDEDARDRTEVAVRLDGERRHFSVSVSPIEHGTGDAAGRVVVLRDITPVKRREEELDLLRQVLTRVLRHDLRTELTLIQGHVDDLHEEYDDPRIEEIAEAGDALLDIGEKTRQIDRIVRADAELERSDLADVLDEALADIREHHPDLALTAAVPDACPVRCRPGLRVAVANLLENAAEHAGAADAEVHVFVEDRPDGPLLRIVDDGPGIPDEELVVLAEERETSLSHGSGIGLWLVKWWADRSGVDLSFETGARGTAVSLRFPTDSGAE